MVTRRRFFPKFLRSFWRNERGLSALEFAFILPIMLALYFGCIELGDALTINRKITHVTSTIADLVTQSKILSDADMKNILDASASIITPYDTGKMRMRVTQIRIDPKGKTTVDWSDARNDTALTSGSAITIPDAVKINDSYVVLAEVHYDYAPMIGYVMSGSFDLSDKFYLRPRINAEVCRVSCPP